MSRWIDATFAGFLKVPQLAAREPRGEQIRAHGAVREKPVAFGQERFKWIDGMARLKHPLTGEAGSRAPPPSAHEVRHPPAVHPVSASIPTAAARVPSSGLSGRR